MSIGYIGGPYQLLGGWFGEDGFSLPDDFVLTDGWFGEVPCDCGYLLERLMLLEDLIDENEPIYIGDNGHLHEFNMEVP